MKKLGLFLLAFIITFVGAGSIFSNPIFASDELIETFYSLSSANTDNPYEYILSIHISAEYPENEGLPEKDEDWSKFPSAYISFRGSMESAYTGFYPAEENPPDQRITITGPDGVEYDVGDAMFSDGSFFARISFYNNPAANLIWDYWEAYDDDEKTKNYITIKTHVIFGELLEESYFNPTNPGSYLYDLSSDIYVSYDNSEWDQYIYPHYNGTLHDHPYARLNTYLSTAELVQFFENVPEEIKLVPYVLDDNNQPLYCCYNDETIDISLYGSSYTLRTYTWQPLSDSELNEAVTSNKVKLITCPSDYGEDYLVAPPGHPQTDGFYFKPISDLPEGLMYQDGSNHTDIIEARPSYGYYGEIDFYSDVYIRACNSNLIINNIDSENSPLFNGSFILYKITEDNKIMYYHDISSSPYYEWVDIGSKSPDEAAENNEITMKTATRNNSVSFNNLLPGVYYVKQIYAPNGYMPIDPDIETIITKEDDTKDIEVTAINTAGVVLPETGGIGTDLFYMIGLVLMALACCMTIRFKKKN